jgi:hypothetical protein
LYEYNNCAYQFGLKGFILLPITVHKKIGFVFYLSAKITLLQLLIPVELTFIFTCRKNLSIYQYCHKADFKIIFLSPNQWNLHASIWSGVERGVKHIRVVVL